MDLARCAFVSGRRCKCRYKWIIDYGRRHPDIATKPDIHFGTDRFELRQPPISKPRAGSEAGFGPARARNLLRREKGPKTGPGPGPV